MEIITPGSISGFWPSLLPILGIAYAAFWVYAMIDWAKSNFRAPHEKMIWLLIILFAAPFGVFLYLSMSRNYKERRKFNPDFSRNS